jgi:hypothetical protein
MENLGKASCKNTSSILNTESMQLTPYLMFNGDCEEVRNFFAVTTGGKFNSCRDLKIKQGG